MMIHKDTGEMHEAQCRIQLVVLKMMSQCEGEIETVLCCQRQTTETELNLKTFWGTESPASWAGLHVYLQIALRYQHLMQQQQQLVLVAQ